MALLSPGEPLSGNPEMERLRKENAELRKENAGLRRKLKHDQVVSETQNRPAGMKKRIPADSELSRTKKVKVP